MKYMESENKVPCQDGSIIKYNIISPKVASLSET
jgi:hypothetical protein